MRKPAKQQIRTITTTIQITAPPRSFFIKAILVRSAFGVIELLITLLIVSVLAWQAIRMHKGTKTDPNSPATLLENQLRADIELGDPARITNLSLTTLAATRPNGSIRYEWSGIPPRASVVRIGADGKAFGPIERIAFLRFNGIDEKGWIVSDNPGPDEMARIVKVRVEIGVHDAAESPNHIVNDKITGIDLDGDPSNGTAKIKSSRFGLILRTN